MKQDFSFGEYAAHSRVGAFLTWLAFAGIVLGTAIWLNVNPLMSAKWVTLVGLPDNPASDSIQLETDSSAPPVRDRVVRLRINRAVEVDGLIGVAYRSFDGTASVDCHERRARYTKGTYYNQPNFKGAPVAQKSFDSAEQPPVVLRGFDPGYTRQVVELGCK